MINAASPTLRQRLTHWGQDKTTTILQTAYLDAYS